MNPVLRQLEQRLATALHGLDSSQTQLRPTSDLSCWSIQQITEHLLMTYASTAVSFERRLAKGTPLARVPPPRIARDSSWSLPLGLMPGRRKAPPEVTPPASAPSLSGDELIMTAHESLNRLDHLFDQALQSFGAARCLSHSSLGPLSPSQWRLFHLSHGNHHIRQIAAIRRAHGL